MASSFGVCFQSFSIIFIFILKKQTKKTNKRMIKKNRGPKTTSAILSLIVLLIAVNNIYPSSSYSSLDLNDIFEQTELEYRTERLKRAAGSLSADQRTIRASNLKSTPESSRIHDSFMLALRVSQKLASSNSSSSSSLSSLKLKSPPKFCPFSFELTCDNSSKYRQIDGSCNNLGSSLIGRSSTPYKRLAKPAYEDGMNEPRRSAVDGSALPNARLVSLVVHTPQDTPARITNLGVMFGQFIDHDFAQSAATGVGSTPLKCSCGSFNADCVNINTPDEDEIDNDQQCMVLTRSAASFDHFDCTLNAREQTNLATHWLDLSHVYGTDSAQASKLRSFVGGRLKTSSIGSMGAGREFLPPADAGGCVDETNGEFCFESGDSRTSQNMMLVSIHTIWLREHNRVARSLQRMHPTWSDESLYQETRRILIAEYQHIIYNEWLAPIVGDSIYRANDLKPLADGYFMRYDPNTNPHLAAEFSTVAFRFGHSMLRSTMSKSDSSLVEIANLTLSDIILRPTEAFENGGLDSICRGLLVDAGTTFDPHFTDQIQNHLFETSAFSAQTKRFSLSAINIMRGRDHGIAPYVEFRRLVSGGLFPQEAKSFDELVEIPPSARDVLKRVYKNVRDIDAYSGGTSEASLAGALLGPTFANLVARQFRELKVGDRFYYENGVDVNTRFSESQLREIRHSSMSRIVCDNLDVKFVQVNAFLPPSISDNPLVECKSLRNVDLRQWKSEKLPADVFANSQFDFSA